jgi:hypothetical protein
MRRKRKRRVRRYAKNRFVGLDYFVRGESGYRAPIEARPADWAVGLLARWPCVSLQPRS